MIYIHYCSRCNIIRMLNGHKPNCPACNYPLTELSVSFAEYTNLSAGQRRLLLEHLQRKHT